MLVGEEYVLQLRDNNPDIAAPGQWSLFGGLVEKGEKPIVTVRREIYEELTIQPPHYTFLWHIDYIPEYGFIREMRR